MRPNPTAAMIPLTYSTHKKEMRHMINKCLNIQTVLVLCKHFGRCTVMDWISTISEKLHRYGQAKGDFDII